MPKFNFSETTLAYFQFVFAAITPLLFLRQCVGRMNFKVWLIFVPLVVDVRLLGQRVPVVGRRLVGRGGCPGLLRWVRDPPRRRDNRFVAAAVIGPRLQRDREHAVPNKPSDGRGRRRRPVVGWNGFNGGDPYFAGADASIAVPQHQPGDRLRLAHLGDLGHLREQAAQADVPRRHQRHDHRPGRDHPAAGFVTSFGAMIIGVVASSLVWMSWNWLGKTRPFKKVDDTLGVFHTHGVAGLAGGLLVGCWQTRRLSNTCPAGVRAALAPLAGVR